MVELRVCSFCGKEIEPGTGRMFIKKDGTVFLFCSNKCSKNMVDMKRVPRRTTWTRAYAREKDARMATAPAPKAEEKPAEAPVEAPSEEPAKPKAKSTKAPKAKKVKAAEAPKTEAPKAEEAKPKEQPKPEASTEEKKE
jgi:large subunit ribosomal protein L24e